MFRTRRRYTPLLLFRAPLRLIDASFELLRAMGTVEAVGVVTQLLLFNQQGSGADFWITNVATSTGMLRGR